MEAARYNVTGLVPRSEAWYEFYWDKLHRLFAGEEINIRIPLAALDELVRRGSAEEEERKAGNLYRSWRPDVAGRGRRVADSESGGLAPVISTYR